MYGVMVLHISDEEPLSEFELFSFWIYNKIIDLKLKFVNIHSEMVSVLFRIKHLVSFQLWWICLVLVFWSFSFGSLLRRHVVRIIATQVIYSIYLRMSYVTFDSNTKCLCDLHFDMRSMWKKKFSKSPALFEAAVDGVDSFQMYVNRVFYRNSIGVGCLTVHQTENFNATVLKVDTWCYWICIYLSFLARLSPFHILW